MGAVPNSEYAEESAEVEVLLAQAKKHEEMGRKIKASLLRVEENGRRLEKLVSPVRNALDDARDLNTMISNAGKLLDSIDRASRPMEGKADEEKVLRQGPRAVGLDTYLRSLNRVQAQLAQINQAPMRMNQESAREVAQLQEYGTRQVLDVFDTLLREDNKPVEPQSYSVKGVPFPEIPPAKIRQMKDINAVTSSQQSARSVTSHPTVQNYADVRGLYLLKTLQGMAQINVSSARSLKPDQLYRARQHPIADYTHAMAEIFKAEWSNISAIFGRDECSVVFEQTTAKALEDFEATLSEINSIIARNVTSFCFLAYEILGSVSKLSQRVNDSTGQLRQQINDTTKSIRHTAMNSLGDMLDDIRRQIANTMTLPSDGAAIPFTSIVMKRIQSLCENRSTIASIMTSLGDGGWLKNRPQPSRTFDVGPDRDMLLSHYVVDTLDTLFSSLEDKAKSYYRSKPLLGIFVANNVAVAERKLRNSEVKLNLGSPSKIDFWTKRGTAAYLESWREPCSALMDVQYTNRGPRPQSGSTVDSASIIKQLSSKDKDQIKEKFKTFNISFDSLSAKHREMSRNMEPDVKVQVTREVSALIEPLYGRFYDRYHEIDKGKGKYVKYDKASLSSQIAALS